MQLSYCSLLRENVDDLELFSVANGKLISRWSVCPHGKLTYQCSAFPSSLTLKFSFLPQHHILVLFFSSLPFSVLKHTLFRLHQGCISLFSQSHYYSLPPFLLGKGLHCGAQAGFEHVTILILLSQPPKSWMQAQTIQVFIDWINYSATVNPDAAQPHGGEQSSPQISIRPHELQNNNVFIAVLLVYK